MITTLLKAIRFVILPPSNIRDVANRCGRRGDIVLDRYSLSRVWPWSESKSLQPDGSVAYTDLSLDAVSYPTLKRPVKCHLSVVISSLDRKL